MRIISSFALVLVTLTTVHAEPSAVALDKLGLALEIDAPNVEVFDTDVTGKPLKPDSINVAELRLETANKDLGTLHVAIRKKPESAAEFLDRQKKIISPDMTNLVTTKLADGWLVTYQYNKDRYYAVTASRKIGKRWIRCDARPDSAEASAIAVAAFKSVRAATPAK